MNDSNPRPETTSPRATLKLKVAARKAPEERKAPPPPPPPAKSKPGAHWSDEYKQRMQADMDKLTSR
jgi:hypothetical protein